jgi:TRAP-type mannitol/chloroaromatic compound transport system permease large subunit
MTRLAWRWSIPSGSASCFLICLQLGLLTPPFGMLLFTMKSVAPREITMGQVYRAVTPYVLFGLLMLAVVWLAPSVATGLPRLLFGK